MCALAHILNSYFELRKRERKYCAWVLIFASFACCLRESHHHLSRICGNRSNLRCGEHNAASQQIVHFLRPTERTIAIPMMMPACPTQRHGFGGARVRCGSVSASPRCSLFSSREQLKCKSINSFMVYKFVVRASVRVSIAKRLRRTHTNRHEDMCVD